MTSLSDRKERLVEFTSQFIRTDLAMLPTVTNLVHRLSYTQPSIYCFHQILPFLNLNNNNVQTSILLCNQKYREEVIGFPIIKPSRCLSHNSQM